ncbi:DUF302 domain-containing protein [Roseomonas sp. CAU 1739]
MPPSTVVVFGNPRMGTPNFLRQPTLALDLPLRALLWQDQAGKVSVSWNSARCLFGTIYPRHGMGKSGLTLQAVSMGSIKHHVDPRSARYKWVWAPNPLLFLTIFASSAGAAMRRLGLRAPHCCAAGG